MSERPHDDTESAFYAFEIPPTLAAHLFSQSAGRGRDAVSFADLIGSIRPGLWHRAVQDDGLKTERGRTYRDGLIAMIPPLGDQIELPRLMGQILVMGYDDIDQSHIELMFSRETIRAVVNALSEAVAESERVELTARAAQDAVAQLRRQEDNR